MYPHVFGLKDSTGGIRFRVLFAKDILSPEQVRGAFADAVKTYCASSSKFFVTDIDASYDSIFDLLVAGGLFEEQSVPMAWLNEDVVDMIAMSEVGIPVQPWVGMLDVGSYTFPDMSMGSPVVGIQ